MYNWYCQFHKYLARTLTILNVNNNTKINISMTDIRTNNVLLKADIIINKLTHLSPNTFRNAGEDQH